MANRPARDKWYVALAWLWRMRYLFGKCIIWFCKSTIWLWALNCCAVGMYTWQSDLSDSKQTFKDSVLLGINSALRKLCLYIYIANKNKTKVAKLQQNIYPLFRKWKHVSNEVWESVYCIEPLLYTMRTCIVQQSPQLSCSSTEVL